MDYGGCNQEVALVMNYVGYGYNPECLVAVGYGGQGQGYAHSGSYNNQSSRPGNLIQLRLQLQQQCAL